MRKAGSRGADADLELEGATGAVTGANQAGHHYTGVDLARDADAL